MYLRQVAQLGLIVPERLHGGVYHRYSGDLNELGKGEILVWTSA
jgi:hypothetical protein